MGTWSTTRQRLHLCEISSWSDKVSLSEMSDDDKIDQEINIERAVKSLEYFIHGANDDI